MPIDHSKNIIEIKNLSFQYEDDLVLDKINLNIHQGDYLGVVGPNGGGKTTLLKLILNLLPLQTGEIKIFGQNIGQFNDWYKLGYVQQKAVNFDSKFPATVEEIVYMGRFGQKGLFGRINDEDRKIVHESLNHVGMWEFKDRLIGNLSAGQQQRIFIARALASKPEILFLDEPTVGIDIEAQEQFYRLLHELNSKLNLTLVLVSHDIDVVASEASEFACINKGLVYHGSPQTFIKDDYLKQLYGKDVKFILHHH
jgi:zinc transport system ATP-binding protein